MTNRKFSRKRFGQALGLLALGLVLLVGSAEYGSADYGRMGAQQQVWVATQEEESPATFSIEATVNRNGGLQAQLPDPPDGPGVFLEVQWVVDVSREPHQLVPKGTRVAIMGVAKGRLTQFKSLEDLGSLNFLASVGSGAGARDLVAEVTSSSWSSGSGMSGTTMLNIFLPKIAMVLAPEGPPFAWFNAGFLCCERPRANLVTGPLNPGAPNPDLPVPGGGIVPPGPLPAIPGDPGEPQPPPPGRTFEDAPPGGGPAVRVVVLNFDVILGINCVVGGGGCIGSLHGRVEQHPRQGAAAPGGALPTKATLEVSRAKDLGVCDGNERFVRVRVRYWATYPLGGGPVFGPLVVHLTTGAAALPAPPGAPPGTGPRIPPGIVKDNGRGNVLDLYITSGGFDTSKANKDPAKGPVGSFPVTWKETKK
jgi:hypothetical protein